MIKVCRDIMYKSVQVFGDMIVNGDLIVTGDVIIKGSLVSLHTEIKRCDLEEAVNICKENDIKILPVYVNSNYSNETKPIVTTHLKINFKKDWNLLYPYEVSYNCPHCLKEHIVGYEANEKVAKEIRYCSSCGERIEIKTDIRGK